MTSGSSSIESVPGEKVERVKISVVIDNYNYGRYLPEAIESCLRQTHLPHEIIVVDDGSTDESREVLLPYRDNPLIRIVLKENGGQASALQAGFDLATGDWILGLDSDDYYLPTCLEEIARRTAPEISWIYFRCQAFDTSQKILQIIPSQKLRLPEGDLKTKWLMAKAPTIFPPQSFNCYATGLIRSFPVYPNPEVDLIKSLPADTYLPVVAALNGRVAAIPKILGAYRQHEKGDATIRRKTLAGIHSLIRADSARETWILRLLEDSYGLRMKGPISHTVNFAHWELRYRSLLQDASIHPHPEDSLGRLFFIGLSRLWKDDRWSLPKKLSRSWKWVLMGLFQKHSERIFAFKFWQHLSLRR